MSAAITMWPSDDLNHDRETPPSSRRETLSPFFYILHGLTDVFGIDLFV